MQGRALVLLGRLAITGIAFGWILRWVNVATLLQTLGTAHRGWLFIGIGCFFATQFAGIARWRLLIAAHPTLTWGFLVRSFFVASFFNTILPTTVGGDVVRGYDLIKATGQWKESLASILMDRLVGLIGLTALALVAWAALPTARDDPFLRAAFFGFCLVVLSTAGVLGSRRVLRAGLRPFARIGLGQLQIHAKQFQESLLSYRRQPKTLLKALGITLGLQAGAILMFGAVSQALRLPIPLGYLLLIVPIVAMVSQLPISLNGWGIREGATILFLERIGIGPSQALSFSLIGAVIPLFGGMIGGILFLSRRHRRR
jgi:uncharacterized membrane protein YbhN (UPF0104 family)